MTFEHAKAFVKNLQTDNEFRKEIRAAKNADREALIQNAGFTFSGDELSKAAKDISDKDLSTVIGGITGVGSAGTQVGRCPYRWCTRVL
jgi:predicted ribosomally synthesized peptide with nif11-like leader